MPSIRETLQELGVPVEQVLTELSQGTGAAHNNNGTVPTPLTNYLDVRHSGSGGWGWEGGVDEQKSTEW